MMRDLGVGGAVIGHLSAVYFFGYAGSQVPIGMLIDRFGPRRLMTLAALGCVAGCAIFALSPGISGVVVGRFVIGAAAAFSLVGAMAVAGLWFPARRFALLSGLAMMMGMLGAMVGQAPFRLVVEALDWRGAVFALAIGGLVVAIAVWATVRDRPREARSSAPMLAGLARVARSRQTWLIAIAGLGTTGPLLGFAGLWGVPYFVTTLGIDRTAAASITSTMFLGRAVGAQRRPPDSGRCGLPTRGFAAQTRACMSSASQRTSALRRNRPNRARSLPRQAACEPRCAQPVVRFSIHENNSYIAIAIAPMVTSPAKASGMRCWLPAVCIR
ncbi:MAG: MFS transporter, partial [Rubrivivax sp.]|nr:MFS transporter [Rubrivivax sp.]